jgi:hypothetical protein
MIGYKTCLDVEVFPLKLKTLMKIKFASRDPIPRDSWIQTCHYTILWKTNILGTLTICVKSSSMGSSSPNCFWYLWACDSTMCVEPKLRLLVVVRCSYYYNSSCMLVSVGFVGA